MTAPEEEVETEPEAAGTAEELRGAAAACPCAGRAARGVRLHCGRGGGGGRAMVSPRSAPAVRRAARAVARDGAISARSPRDLRAISARSPRDLRAICARSARDLLGRVLDLSARSPRNLRAICARSRQASRSKTCGARASCGPPRCLPPRSEPLTARGAPRQRVRATRTRPPVRRPSGTCATSWCAAGSMRWAASRRPSTTTTAADARRAPGALRHARHWPPPPPPRPPPARPCPVPRRQPAHAISARSPRSRGDPRRRAARRRAAASTRSTTETCPRRPRLDLAATSRPLAQARSPPSRRTSPRALAHRPHRHDYPWPARRSPSCPAPAPSGPAIPNPERPPSARRLRLPVRRAYAPEGPFGVTSGSRPALPRRR